MMKAARGVKPVEKSIKSNDYLVLLAASGIFLCLIYNIALVLLPFFAACLMMSRQQGVALSSKVAGSLFLVSLALSTFFSNNTQTSMMAAVTLLPGVCIYWLISQYSCSLETLRKFIMLLLAAVALLVIATVASAFVYFPDEIAHFLHSGQPRAIPLFVLGKLQNHLLVTPNDILMLNIILPLVAWVWLEKQARYSTLFIGAFIIIATCAVVMFQGRLAFLLLLASVAGLIFYFKKSKWIIYALAVCVTIVSIDLLMGMPLLDKFSHFHFMRLTIWQVAWTMFLDFPWLGMGPQTFKQFYPIYLYKMNLNPLDLADVRNMPWAHSLYMEMLAERGALGLLALLSLLGNSLFLCYRMFRGQMLPRPLVSSLIGALIIFMIVACFESSFSRLWVCTIFGILLGVVDASYRLHRNINSNGLDIE